MDSRSPSITPTTVPRQLAPRAVGFFAAAGAARGFVGGLTRGSTRAHLARGLVEGLAQRCTDLCDALPLKAGPLPVDGGLSRSDLLLQSLADLSGRCIERAAESETTALGAAWLAGLAAGCLERPQACQALRAAPRRFEPRLAADRRWAARERWGRLLERARSRPVDANPASIGLLESP